MTSRTLFAALLATSFIAAPVMAQSSHTKSSHTKSSHTKSSAEATLARIEAMQVELDALRAEVAELRAENAAKASEQTAVIETQSALVAEQGTRLQVVEAAAEADIPTVAWKGAPVISGDGWSFKPRGRIQVDTGNFDVSEALGDPGAGWSTEIRRARLGFEGVIMTDFGYKFEVDFADNQTEIADAFLSWEGKATEIAIGNTKTGVSLEEETSSRFTTFMERAAFTDAYGFERRVGVRVDYSAGAFLLSGNVHTDDINSLTDDGDSQWGVAGRVVYAPKLGETGQLHLGASAQYTEFSGNAQSVRYRQRPNWHGTDIRLVNTGTLMADSDMIYGLEAAGIFGPLHVAGEASWADSDGPAEASAFGGYAEIGYFLTGETRGYRGGAWNRTKVTSPVTSGGMGAFQIAGRVDYLDLEDGNTLGGKQTSYQAGLTWIPMDYVRFLVNYNHLEIDSGPFAASVDPVNGDYTADVFAVRAQIDF